MPELPEVETVRLGLAKVMEGRRIRNVVQRRRDLRFPFPKGFAERLAGRTVRAFGRRGKYLLARLDDGTVLVIHLGMSGSFRIARAATPAEGRAKNGIHDHVIFEMVGGARVIYNDPRRFGFMALLAADDLDSSPQLRALGIDPLDDAFDGAAVARLFAGRNTSLKAALMDQRLVAGLGNIYTCEALWRARLSPMRAAATLARRNGQATARADRLAAGIRAVLKEAIAAGGSSINDHVRADGSLGDFQHAFAVYDRAGAPCPRAGCRGVVRRFVQNGRATFHCPVCQR